MKLPWISALLAMALVADVAVAADARPGRPAMRPNVPDYSLHSEAWHFPSGLQVLLQVDKSHPIVSVFTIVDHGNVDDPVGKEELAHFVEHVWFRSVHEPWPPVMDLITSHTGMFNATTRNDWTDYRTTMSSFYLEKLVAMEAQRLMNPYRGVTEAQIDIEREVVRNEWRARNEQSSALLFDYLNRYLYPADHAYARGSTHESLNAIKLADLQWYFDTFYKPETTTITFVGDLDPLDVQSYIFKHFDPKLLHPDLTEEHIFRQPKPDIDDPDPENDDHWHWLAWDPEHVNEQVLKLADSRQPRVTEAREPLPPLGNSTVGKERAPVDYTTAVFGWSLPGGHRQDHWDLVMLGNLVNGRVMGGLRQIYPEREYGERIGLGSGCGTQPQMVHSTLLCRIEIKDPKLDPEQVIEKAIDQLALLWNPDYSTFFFQGFERSRNSLLADVLLSLDEVASVFGGRAEDIGVHAHYTGMPNYHSHAMEQVMSVQGQRIIKLGFDNLTRKRAARIVVYPLAAADVDTKSSQSTYAGASEESTLSARAVELVPDELIADLYTSLDTSKMVDTTLDNGMRVVILPHSEAPVVQASVIIGGGTSTPPKGLHAFASRFSVSEGHDPLEIAGQTSYPFQPGFMGRAGKAYPMNTASWADGWRVDFKAPSGNLDAALWKLQGELTSIKPALSYKGTWIKNSQESLGRSWTRAGWHSSARRSEHQYPDYDAARPRSWEDLDTWKSWGAGEIRSYLDRHVQPSNAALLIVGNIDADEALASAKTQFGGWKPKDGVETGWVRHSVTPAMPTEPKQILLYDDPKRTQTDLVMMCRLNYDGEEQKPAVKILSSILGDETFQTIRVKEGLAYSPGAQAWVSTDGSAALQFYSQTINSGVGRVMDFVHEAVERIAKGEASAEEINKHKVKLANAGGVDAQSLDQVISYLTAPVRSGRPWTDLTEAGQHIARVAPDTLDDLVKDCLGHAHFSLTGPVSVIAPQLEERGYTYEVVDWEAEGMDMLRKYSPKTAKKVEKEKAAQKLQESAAAGK